MAAKSKPRESRSVKTTHVEERIRLRAYELYEQRGRVDGFALDDWLQAGATTLLHRPAPAGLAPKAARLERVILDELVGRSP